MTSLAFSQTVVRDFVVACEVRRSVVNDRVVATEIGRIARRDDISPIEIGSGAVITLNVAAPIEWTKSISAYSATSPVEWRSSLLGSPLAPVDWRSGLSTDVTVPAASGLLVAVPFLFPSENRLTTVAVSPVPAEWRSPVAGDVLGPAEAGLTVRTDIGAFPVEGGSTVILGAAVPVQFLPTVQRDDILTFESGASTSVAVSDDTRSPLEWRSEMMVDRVIAIAPGEVLLRDTTGQAEWTGGVASYGVIISPVEFGSGAAASIVVPSDSLRSITADRIATLGLISTVVVTSDVVLSYTAVLRVDAVAPIVVNAVRVVSRSAPVEWHIGFAVEFTVESEWTQQLMYDAAWDIDHLAELSVDTVALIETSLTTATRTADAEMPVEWGMTIVVDVVIDGERWFERDSVGASLEPDEWERTHG